MLFWGDRLVLEQYVAGARTVLVEDYAVPTAPGPWYKVTLRALGSRVEVWRAPEGEPPQLVLAHDGVAQATSNTLLLSTYRDVTYAFDDVRLDALTRMRAHYAYDALGRRIAKTVDDGTGPQETHYVWDGWRLAQEYDGEGTLRAAYVYGLGLDELFAMRRDGQDYFYVQDDQGSVLALTDAAGHVLERYAYGPGGEPLVFDAANQPIPQSAHGNPFYFAGAPWDPETGLYYLRYRYYDPGVGRFLTPDPLGAWADPSAWGNLYAYCGNSPWDTVDPFGLGPLDWIVTGRWSPTDEEEQEGYLLFGQYFWSGSAAAADELIGVPTLGLWRPLQDHYDPCDPSTQATQLGTFAAIAPLLLYSGLGSRTAVAVEGEVAAGVVAESAAGAAGRVVGHHPWPQYLQGPAKQVLENLPEALHKAYHRGLDKLLPRRLGTDFYRYLSPQKQAEAFELLRKYTQAFDKVHGTDLWEAIKRVAASTPWEP